MQTEVVFHPQRSDPAYLRQVALIAGGFFVFVQLAFLEGLAARLAFTLVFAGFLLVGVWISGRIRRTWPQEIVMNRAGIGYGDLRSRHGVDSLPWREVERLDLFYTQHNMAPFLRIGLRHGAFRQRLRRPRLQRWSRGLDVNIPVAVDAAPEVVLETARRFWSAAGERDAVHVDRIDSMARFPMPIPMKDQDAS
ncbi:hypothetical protein [Thiococcus pfennigii]|uniref:hypothetical protein n=1 Tax=Thiococcus pfennigii TaxID=1057 RepID=UPI001903EB8E|nr:hypothetical protein [Thiococcus pfennigii]MBK1731745.1 hypothetical protein [Thiococcus pfennigii]